MRHLRLILIVIAASAIAFALYSADQNGVSATSPQFLLTQGVAFVGGFLGAAAIFMKGKTKKE